MSSALRLGFQSRYRAPTVQHIFPARKMSGNDDAVSAALNETRNPRWEGTQDLKINLKCSAHKFPLTKTISFPFKLFGTEELFADNFSTQVSSFFVT
jgi:hypothetical protein